MKLYRVATSEIYFPFIILLDIPNNNPQCKVGDSYSHDDIVHPDEIECSESCDYIIQGLQETLIEPRNTPITIQCNMKQFGTLEPFSDLPNCTRYLSDVPSKYTQTFSDGDLKPHVVTTMSPNYQNSEGNSSRSSFSSTHGSHIN